MKITQDLREEVLAMAEREKGMAEKSAEFLEKGGKLYVLSKKIRRGGADFDQANPAQGQNSICRCAASIISLGGSAAISWAITCAAWF